MLAELSPEIAWLCENLTSVNVIELRIRRHGMMGSLETDRKTERLIFFRGVSHEVTPECTV